MSKMHFISTVVLSFAVSSLFADKRTILSVPEGPPQRFAE